MNLNSTADKVFNVANAFFLCCLACLSIYPFLYTLSLSFTPANDAAAGIVKLIPDTITLTSYKMVLGNPEIVTGYVNTILRTIIGTISTLLVTSMFAYPLSRPNMPYRKLLTFIVILTMIFHGGLVPSYLIINNLELTNNRLVYILPHLIAAFNVIIIKNFFLQIPESLCEAAKIDGANELYIFFKIYLPLSKPVLATVGLWTAVMHWNIWFDAMIYISDDSLQVLQTFLRRIVIESNIDLAEIGASEIETSSFTPETIKAATVIITILPMLIIYPFVQKYFVKGINVGGVKE